MHLIELTPELNNQSVVGMTVDTMGWSYLPKLETIFLMKPNADNSLFAYCNKCSVQCRMAVITSAMDDVYYEKRNFNYDLRDHRHPLWITEKHWIYHLQKDKNDKLVCTRNMDGKCLCSAR